MVLSGRPEGRAHGWCPPGLFAGRFSLMLVSTFSEHPPSPLTPSILMAHTTSTSTQAAPLPMCPTAPPTWHVPNPFFLLCPFIWLTEPLPHRSPATILEAILVSPPQHFLMAPVLPLLLPCHPGLLSLVSWTLLREFGNFSLPPYFTPFSNPLSTLQ